MRSRLLVFSLFLLFITTKGYAAINSYGFYGGFNLSNANTTTAVDKSSRTGGLVGTRATFKISNAWEFSPEFTLIEKGLVDNSTTATIQFAYFEVPLFIRLGFGGAKTRFHLFGGPSFATLLSSNAHYSNGTDVRIGDNFERGEFCLQHGIEMNHWFSNKTGIFSSLRVSQGLTNISKTSAPYRSFGIYFLVGLSFRDYDRDDELESRAKSFIDRRNVGTPPETEEAILDE